MKADGSETSTTGGVLGRQHGQRTHQTHALKEEAGIGASTGVLDSAVLAGKLRVVVEHEEEDIWLEIGGYPLQRHVSEDDVLCSDNPSSLEPQVQHHIAAGSERGWDS